MIFEHRLDKQLEIKEIFLDILDKITLRNGALIPDKSGKTYIRFTSSKIDKLIPHQGDGWTDTKRLLLFELKNTAQSLTLYFIIGPGESTLREKLHSMALSNNNVFPLAKKVLAKQWSSIWKSTVLRKKDIENLEGEELQEKINAFIERFQEEDLPQIEDVITREFEE